jgi:hypothetical protein
MSWGLDAHTVSESESESEFVFVFVFEGGPGVSVGGSRKPIP